MRNLFIALDRPDILLASKEISRAMALPTVSADETLKGLARYYFTVPRLVWCYPRQPMRSKIVVLSDADCAACPVTRKYSGCIRLMLGRHPILAGTATQAVLSLSSRERDLCTSVCGACGTVGLASLMADLAVGMQAELCTAARWRALRRGARQVRHIHCPAPSPQPATATRKIPVGSQADAALSAGVGTIIQPQESFTDSHGEPEQVQAF